MGDGIMRLWGAARTCQMRSTRLHRLVRNHEEMKALNRKLREGGLQALCGFATRRIQELVELRGRPTRRVPYELPAPELPVKAL
jgi:hypothetical protein